MTTALLDLPHAEARARLAEPGAIAWLPVNPVEYHGPHLPLHTDRLLTHAWLADLHRALHGRALGGSEPLVAADLEIGVDPAPGPGTRTSSYREVHRSVIRACRSLCELGARRVVLLTFHGAPLHNLALYRGVRWLERAGVRAIAPFQEAIRSLGALDRPEADAVFADLPDDVRHAVRSDLDHDFHAGFLETSLMLHWAPDAVSPVHRTLPPCPPIPPLLALRGLARLAGAVGLATAAHELGVGAIAGGWTSLRPFPGYTGHPAHATRNAGRFFAETLTEGVVELVAGALAGTRSSPPPPFGWVGPLTLWGRIGPPAPSPAEILAAPETSLVN